MSAGGDSTKVIVLAFVANLGIAGAKFIGAYITKSASMLAEAIHSLVDSSNQLLLLVGNKQAKKAATPLHPLGYGREAFFWSFIVAILLFSLGGMFAIYEGIHKLRAPEESSSPAVALAILGVAIVLEWISFKACLKEVKRQNRFGSLWAWFKKTTASELLVVFTEDLAAMAGLLIAAAAVFLSWITGNAAWDAIGSIVVGSILVIVAVLLAIEIKSLIVGESPSVDYRMFVEALVGQEIPLGKVLNFIALQIGANEVMLSYKIHPGGQDSVEGLVHAINRLETETKKRFPEVKWQFVEPDFAD